MGHHNATRVKGPDLVQSDTTCEGHGLCRHNTGIEGIVAKRATSVYTAGRIWKKVRHAETVEADVVGCANISVLVTPVSC